MRSWSLGLLALLALMPSAAADPLQETLLLACAQVPSEHSIDLWPIGEIPFQRDFFETVEYDLEHPGDYCEENARNVYSPL